jgi:ATP-dependent protease ClpP protease subunit
MTSKSKLWAGDVNEAFLTALHDWYWRDSMADLPLYLHTQGGDLGVAAAVVDLILTQKKPTTIIAAGEVGSAGVLVYLAAKRRLALPNARFFFHPATVSGQQLSTTDLDNEIGELSARSSLFADLWTDQGCVLLPGMLTKTFYVDALKAKTHKLVQDIVKLPFKSV